MAFVGVYRALFDYAPQSDEELEIKDGDLLFVLEKSSDDDWWKCKKKAASDEDDEPEGLVPANYVEEVKPTHPAKALYDYTQQTEEELSFQEGAQLQVYDQTDPDWTLVGQNGDFGFVPAIYIEHLLAGATAASAAPAMPPRTPTAYDGPLPGEADYAPPSSSGTAATGPAAALAGILAQKTGGGADTSPSTQRTLAAPPPTAARPQYTPDESEEEDIPPPKPQRPQSQTIPSSPPAQAPIRVQTRKESQYIPSGTAEAGGILPSPPSSARTPTFDDYDGPRSPAGYRLYSIHEVISHMGKSKKLPMTLGINLHKGIIKISPDKSRDGEAVEWSAEKLEHYSIEGKHVFVELVRPSRSVHFHAGAKETAQEIVAHLGEVAGASRLGGLKEVIDASQNGTGTAGLKTGQMLHEFMAQGDDEVTVAVGDEVIILDDSQSEEWWLVKRLKNGKEGVVPSSYVEITGTVPAAPDTALMAARSTVEQNRLEEERLAKDAAKSSRGIPERGSSLADDSSSSSRSKSKRGTKEPSGAGKSKPNPSRVRMWTDRSGTFKVEAEFIGLREGKIHLHKTNGVKIAVPVAKMSVVDLEYVEKATGASLDEDKPLSEIKRRSTQKAKTNGAGATIVPKDHEYWFDFFLQCGVNPQICDRYASAFSRDQMSPEVLPEVNEQLLRTLGLKEGDILRVVKFLDTKYDRKRTIVGGVSSSSVGDDPDKIEQANGSGLFSGPGGALKNNTRKGRPAPAISTTDVVSEDAFRSSSPAARSPNEGAQRTVLASAPAREPKSGFDDDAWDVKPARTQTPELRKVEEPPRPVEPPRPRVNDDIASLSITSPPLQPTIVAPPPAPAPSQAPPPLEQQSTNPPGANSEIFDKIASLAPRQRPQPPAQQQQSGGALGVPPPPRAASAPGFQPQQNSFGHVAPLQAQLTGYQSQYQQPLQPQQTAFQGYGGLQGQQPNGMPNGFMPQQTGIQAMQQNYPALQPQPTGLNFQPQSSFGQQQQSQFYGGPGFQQQLVNGAETGSPFADPPRLPYQPNAPSGLQNSFSMPQQTGFQQQQTGLQQQPGFNIAAPTGMNGGYGAQPQPGGAPQLPPQQTGGVFGPSQPLTPLVPQKTGPPPPVRFGVQPGEKKLMPQPTGRANLAKATPQNPFGF